MKRHCTPLASLPTLGLVLAVILSGAGLVRAAAVVSIDITTDGTESVLYSGSATTHGLEPLPGQVGDWNDLNLGAELTSFTTEKSITNALDGDGNATTIDFRLNTNGQTLTSFDGNGADDLGGDIAFATSNAVVGWQFDGLEPNTQYLIRFFGQYDLVGGHTNFTTFTVPGSPTVSATTTASQNFVDLLVVSDGAGTIAGTLERAEGSTTLSVSAVQIVLPEPGALSILGGSALMLFARRRRR